jgi:hypothetical protein
MNGCVAPLQGFALLPASLNPRVIVSFRAQPRSPVAAVNHFFLFLVY